MRLYSELADWFHLLTAPEDYAFEDRRQVDGARLALQHNIGLGGACVVTLYERVAAG